MREGAIRRFSRGSFAIAVVLTQVCTVAAQASTPSVEPAPIEAPATAAPSPTPDTVPPPPAAEVPPAPSNYAVPPPPAAAPPRYPSAPNLAPVHDTTTETEAVAPQLQMPARVATRLRVLSTDLNTLAARGGGGIADGIFSIVVGSAMITFGAISISDNSLDILAPSLLVFGGASVARGLIDLFVVPNPYVMMLDFTHLPMTTIDEVKARLRFGESALEELSDRNRLARLLDGAVSLGGGATLLGLTLSVNSKNNSATGEDNTIGMVIGILGATTMAIGGAISLLSPSDAERRWEAYQGLRDRLSREHARQRSTAALTGVPRVHAVLTPRLLMGAVSVTL